MDTMQFREWDRGFNKAFSENLKRVTKHEQTREQRQQNWLKEKYKMTDFNSYQRSSAKDSYL